MSERGWAVAASIFGALTLATFVAFALLPEMHAASACLPPGSVVQFELARNDADIAALFGAPDSACRPLAVAAMDAVNTLDVRFFIPIYTLFCLCAVGFLARGRFRGLAWIGASAALVALVGDYVETFALLDTTRVLDDPSALPLLMSATLLGAWTKFAALAVHALICAGLCWTGTPKRRVLGLVLLLPTPGVLAAAYDHHALAALMNGAFGLAWAALLIAAVLGTLRSKPA